MQVEINVSEDMALACIVECLGLGEVISSKVIFDQQIKAYIFNYGISCIADHIQEYKNHIPAAKILLNKYLK